MPKKNADRDPHFAAYRAAKAEHKAAIAALKQAKVASHELIERRAAAATAEFMALSALLRKPRAPLAAEAPRPGALAADERTSDPSADRDRDAPSQLVRRKSPRSLAPAES